MKLYRYEAENYPHTVRLELREFTMLRETPCGYWVSEFYIEGCDKYNEVNKRWVSKTSRKRYCYPTKEEAMNSFKIRKNRHVSILKGQLAIAEIACGLNEATDVIKKPDFLYFEYD